MFKTRAIRFIQNHRVLYSVVIPAGELVQLAKVDVWESEKESTGYQRAPSDARKREIGEYAMRPDSIMPIGGLLSARAEEHSDGAAYGTRLEFEQEYADGDISFGILTIPDRALPLYIVDMQHRLGGYEWAMQQMEGQRLDAFPLLVTIADGLSKMEEVDQFDIINTTQKKVHTDLARRLKSMQVRDANHMLALDQRGQLWEARGPVIAQKLNTQAGPWRGRILPPNKAKADQPSMIVHETSFVTSLKPILQTPYFVRQSEDNAAELINRYWAAIQKIWPEAFSDPEAHVIQKSPGLFSLHELAPEVFEMVRDRGGITIENIYEVTRPLAAVGDSDFWSGWNDQGASAYGSMKGFRILASELRQHLPKIGS